MKNILVLKRLLIYLGIFVLMLPMIFAPLAPCTTEDTTTSAAFTSVDTDIDESITFGDDQIFGSILNLTPTTTFNFTNGFNESFVLLNNTNSSLYWPGIDINSVLIINGSDDILGSANYTVYPIPGIIYWNLTNAAGWNDSVNVYVYYNKSFFALETDLVALGLGYDEGAAPGYGGTKTWGLSRTELNSTDWTVFYTYTDRECAARDSCLGTRATIYAGFALIAVAIIVLSSFAIIKLISGDMTGVALGVLAVSIIGLAVIIMIGYYITSVVGTSVCNAAVA